jgi:predicted acetyltransferase
VSVAKASRAVSLLKVEVVPAAPEQEPILANLLQLYAHDFSAFHDVPMLADGRFGGYKDLHLYWSEADRHPFLVWVDGKLAGFVFATRGSEVSGDKNIWDVAEFFVLRGYRRRGVGIQIAHDVWRRFPGAWEVRVMEANTSACQFWERAIAAFTGAVVLPVRVEKDGQGWALFSFESRGSV